MTLIPVGNGQFVGFSGDRPLVGIVSGSRFTDVNTGEESFWTGSVWRQAPRTVASGASVTGIITGSGIFSNDITFSGVVTLSRYAEPYKYFLYFDSVDQKYKARNGRTGKIDFESTNASGCGDLIQNAIDASGYAGGIIEFASDTTFPLYNENTNLYTPTDPAYSGGTYRYSILVRPNQWYRGGGWSTKIVGADPNGANGVGIFFGDARQSGIPTSVSGAGDIAFSDLWLEGRCIDGSSGKGSTGNIKLFGFNRVIFKNLKSRYPPQANIQALYSNYFLADGCYIEGSRLDGGTGIGALMSAYTSDEVIMTNNILKNCGGESIGVYYGPHNFVIKGNTSITTTDSPLIESYGRGQLHVESSTAEPPTAKYGVISDNVVWSNYYGVSMLSSSFIDIHDNVFRNTGFTDPSDARTYASGAGIAGQQVGIKLVGECIGIQIHDNTFFDIGHHGIYTEAIGNINYLSGIQMLLDIHDNKIVNPSRAYSGQHDGIYINNLTTRDGDSLNIHDNTIVDTVSGALQMRDGIRVDLGSARTLTNFSYHDNQIKGYTNARTSMNLSGTVTFSNRNQGIYTTGGQSGISITIPHKLAETPTWWSVNAVSSGARNVFNVSGNASGLVVTYGANLTSGANNLVYSWRAEIQ